MKTIDALTLHRSLQKGENYTIIDVREPYEREICSINAISIPMGEIHEKYQDIPQSSKAVVMCRTGQRAEAVINYLESNFQLNNLWLLEGGLMAWIDEVDQELERY